MLSRFKRNAVISAYVNSYCLVCEKYFDTEEATIAHIDEDFHLKKLLSHPYLEKYGDNHIRKVNKGYFCEFCNLLLATATNVSLHVQEQGHYDSKGNFMLCQCNGVVVAFENVMISERAWHGVTNNTCTLCNIEFDNEDVHRSEPMHLLKLVQNKLMFGPNNNLYRKIDKSSFQCLTCNSVFALDKVDKHFNDPEHQRLYAKCQGDKTKYPALKTESTDKSTQPKIEKPLKENNGNTANKNKEANDCKEEFKSYKKLLTPESIIFANENNITYWADGGKMNTYCHLCQKKIPSTLPSIKDHIKENDHKTRSVKAAEAAKTAEAAKRAEAAKTAEAAKKAAASKPKNTLKRGQLIKFIEHIMLFDQLFPRHQDLVINEKYCIDQISFMMITPNGSRFRCQICEVNLDGPDDIEEHANSDRHSDKLLEIPIITSMADKEFITEVRKNVFHCAFCNQVYVGVDALHAHTRGAEHRAAHDAAAARLKVYLPAVQKDRREKDHSFLKLAGMLENLRVKSVYQ